MTRKIRSTLLSLLCLTATVVACTPTASPVASETTDTATHAEATVGITQAETFPVTETPTEALTEISTDTEAITEEETTVNVRYETIQNPVCAKGNDPWVVQHEGKYYYCYASPVWLFGGLAVAEIPSISEISEENAKQVYTAPDKTAYSFEYWAPELHYLNGEWYIYVAADDGNNENHRMYVLKGTSQDPTEPFEMIGQITDPSDKWAIDGTVMELNGELYFIWSGWEGDMNVAQNIYIAHMSDPCTIDSERVCLSVPEYTWEKKGEPYVNEGPTVLQHDGKTFLVYSASGSWTDDYCLGMLTLTGEDPMDPASWQKSETAVFKKRVGTAYGPGHNSFATACDGSVWMIYHANQQAGTGWAGRSVWISPVTFDKNGMPEFGRPEKEVSFPVEVAP